jgi:hypothetical protein
MDKRSVLHWLIIFPIIHLLKPFINFIIYPIFKMKIKFLHFKFYKVKIVKTELHFDWIE